MRSLLVAECLSICVMFVLRGAQNIAPLVPAPDCVVRRSRVRALAGPILMVLKITEESLVPFCDKKWIDIFVFSDKEE